MIRVGVIGTGVMGAYHAHLLNGTIAGAALGGTFDIDAARAAEVAAQAPGARSGRLRQAEHHGAPKSLRSARHAPHRGRFSRGPSGVLGVVPGRARRYGL